QESLVRHMSGEYASGHAPGLPGRASARPPSSAPPLRACLPGLARSSVPALLAEQLIALTIDETSARPVALVIDDLQWADPASVKLWGRLATRCTSPNCSRR